MQSEIVENHCRVLALPDLSLELLKLVSYNLAAGETSNWDYHLSFSSPV
jgi:hypothetical protein